MGRHSVMEFSFDTPESYSEDTHVKLAFLVRSRLALQLFYVHILFLRNENRIGSSAFAGHGWVAVVSPFRDTRYSDTICHYCG